MGILFEGKKKEFFDLQFAAPTIIKKEM